MFKNIKENFINLVTSRLFVLVVVFTMLFAVLLHWIFDLQIVNGEDYLNNFKLKIQKERSIPSTRGNIYDRNGKLLAYNELAYSVTIADVFESVTGKNAALNDTIYRLINYIEDNDDSIINDFNIVLDKDNNYQFAVEDKQLQRFLADVYGRKTVEELEYKESTATPDEVVAYLAGKGKYEIGGYRDEAHKIFVPGLGYTKEEVLKILSIRYAMSANSYQKFIPTVVATDVNERTVAVIMENSNELEGVSIAEDTVRKYVDSVYFSHIIGYTGKISQEELTELNNEEALENGNNKEADTSERYNLNDMVGKAGIEQVMERKLQGQDGTEFINVDKQGRVIETSDRVEPIAGNNVYLSIDHDLQVATYNILEQKIAGILYSKILNIKEYVLPENASASNIKIAIYDLYYALLNNNVIDISHFESKYARETEKAVAETFRTQKQLVIDRIAQELLETKTPYNQLSEEYQVYESYIVSMLSSNSKAVLQEKLVDSEDEIYQAWHKDESISLNEYLNHAIARNWIDVTKLDLSSQYSDSEEIYSQLVAYIIENLDNNTEFSKKLYKYMLLNDQITGKQICQILCEQNIIDVPESEENALRNGAVSPYNFMMERIKNLDITPAQLALDPCSGSCVVTDVNTGEVLALVTYPGYDNNRLANTIDADYFKQLTEDQSRPLWNYATQQLSAPGSTFKMVSATAALEENIVTTGETIICHSSGFDKFTNPPKCWINPGGSHGALNVSGAITNSCNNYFYEVGYRLGQNAGSYDSDKGLEKLAEYADLYGLSEPSGIELPESEPKLSDTDAVRSAIGQGTNNFTTAGLARYVTTVANSGTCYNLSLLDKLTDSNGNLLEYYTPTVRNRVDIAQSSWNAIHRGMRGVVENKAYYQDLKVNVAGKTGTAQENRRRPNHALFVGYAPYENPEISIATRVAFGYTSDYAAEISRDVFKYYFHLEDEDALLNGTASAPEATGGGGD
ncbi:MAG: penicillin-binding protein [Clostridiales bacterium]|nr:penicillin-binding protein [Clostridiales bacterium]